MDENGEHHFVAWDGKPFRSLAVEELGSQYMNSREREFINYIFHSRKPHLINAYADWLCRIAEKNSEITKVHSVKIQFHLRKEGASRTEFEKVQVFPFRHEKGRQRVQYIEG